MTIVQFVTMLLHNPVSGGLVGAGFIGSLVFTLKNVPHLILAFLSRYYITKLTIKGNHPFYPAFNVWLARNDFSNKSTRINIASEKTNDAYLNHLGDDKNKFTLGFGTHLIWYKHRPVWITRDRSEKRETGTFRADIFTDETVVVSFFGRSKHLADQMITEAVACASNGDKLAISSYNENYGGFKDPVYKTKRSLDSVFIPQDQKDRIVTDITRFLSNRDIYAQRGTPWRRGILLKGGPGCGKTSIISALASHFGLPIKIINLANVGGDTGFQTAIAEAGGFCFLVFEDVDSVSVTHDRASLTDKDDFKDDQGEKGSLTLSGVLNGLDGLMTPEGRIVIMTTNHPELLDPALIRPGRIDLNETIGPLDEDLARQMIRSFHPDKEELIFKVIEEHLPIPASALQNILLSYD